METNRRYSRTLEEAFGPGHRSSYGIDPMPEPKPKHDAADIALYIVAVIAVLVIVHFAN